MKTNYSNKKICLLTGWNISQNNSTTPITLIYLHYWVRQVKSKNKTGQEAAETWLVAAFCRQKW